MILILLLVSFAVYSNTLLNGFVWDDKEAIVDSHFSREITSLPRTFFTGIWGEGGASNYYRPMIGVIYSLAYLLSGFASWGFHLMNALFHTGVSMLIFLVVSIMFVDYRTSDFPSQPVVKGWAVALSVPFIAALLFAVHPIHTESVAWVSGTTDPSYSFFYLLSLYLYIASDRNNSRVKGKWMYIFSLVSFFLATLCKEPGVTLPLVLIVYDYSFRRGTFFASLADVARRYLPYVAVVGIYLVLRFHALSGFAPGWVSHSELEGSGYVINVFPLFM
ncbi:MAG TPA: hypothetical protein VEI46_08465, partial [Thermodesulfovibrionales bacterium]|nr:hypothetical protein [Thermodesulfovibrionales bacterium]